MASKPFQQSRSILRIVEAVESALYLDNLPPKEVGHEHTRSSDFGTVESVSGSRTHEALDTDDEKALPGFGV